MITNGPDLHTECKRSSGTLLLHRLLCRRWSQLVRSITRGGTDSYKSSLSLRSSPADCGALNILRGSRTSVLPAETSLFEHKRKNALADEILIMQRKVKFFQLYRNVSKLFGIFDSNCVCTPSDAFTLIKTLRQQFPLIKSASVNEITWSSDWRNDTTNSFLGCSGTPCFVFSLQSQSQSKYPSTQQYFFSDFHLEITDYLHCRTWHQTRDKSNQRRGVEWGGWDVYCLSAFSLCHK